MSYGHRKGDGAGSPSSPGTVGFQEVVAGLLKVPGEELQRLNSYTVEECESEMQKLVLSVSKPTGNQPQLTHDVVGQLALLYHRRTQLETEEAAERMAALHASYQAEQTTVSHLEHNLDLMRKEVTQVKEETAQLQQHYEWILQSSGRQGNGEGKDKDLGEQASVVTQRKDPGLPISSPAKGGPLKLGYQEPPPPVAQAGPVQKEAYRPAKEMTPAPPHESTRRSGWITYGTPFPPETTQQPQPTPSGMMGEPSTWAAPAPADVMTPRGAPPSA